MGDGRNHTIFAVNGKVHNLRISFNALADYSKIATLQDFKGKPIPAARALIWAGINAYGSESITLEQAGDLCEDYILDKGLTNFVIESDRILSAGVWLNDKGGTDKGNPTAAPIKPSGNTSKSAKPSRMVSEDSPPESSGISPQ